MTDPPGGRVLQEFRERLRSDADFAATVFASPTKAAQDAGLDEESVRRVAQAVERANDTREVTQLMKLAQDMVSQRGAEGFRTASLEQLLRFGRAAARLTRMARDRSDSELEHWGDPDWWHDRLRQMRAANHDWAVLAADEIARRRRPPGPDAVAYDHAVEALRHLAQLTLS